MILWGRACLTLVSVIKNVVTTTAVISVLKNVYRELLASCYQQHCLSACCVLPVCRHRRHAVSIFVDATHAIKPKQGLPMKVHSSSKPRTYQHEPNGSFFTNARLFTEGSQPLKNLLIFHENKIEPILPHLGQIT